MASFEQRTKTEWRVTCAAQPLHNRIRVPEAGKSFRAKRMVSEGRATASQVERHERACLDALRGYDRGEVSVDSVLDLLHEYDQLITPDRPDNRALLRHTLEARPWKSCPCDICRKDGIDVVIFRGNNRNRRRGFHNTYVFYQLFQRALGGEKFAWMALQIDIGFGDAVTPAAQPVTYPTLLHDVPTPTLRAYPKVTVVAEKPHTATILGM